MPVPFTLSAAEGLALSEAEGSSVEGNVVEGNPEREPSVSPLRRVNWLACHSIGESSGSATGNLADPPGAENRIVRVELAEQLVAPPGIEPGSAA